jgi:hypothetical protein
MDIVPRRELMKALALFLALLFVVSSAPAFCESGTVDTFLENRSESETHMVSDSAKLLQEVKKPADKVVDAVMEPLDKVTDPVMDGANTVLNTTWDALTLKSMRDDD